MDYEKRMLTELKKQQYRTRHLLHLVLSVLTAGLWIPIWILCAISNANERQKLDICGPDHQGMALGAKIAIAILVLFIIVGVFGYMGSM